MIHVAVDPEQHPVDQYRYDSEWSDILQYLSLLYLHSKVPYYQRFGKAFAFNSSMNRYRDLDLYSREFMKFLEEVLDAKEYAYVKGQLENAHSGIKARNFKPMWLRQAFRSLKDDLPHVHSTRIKAVMRPLTEYFKAGSVSAQDLETEAIAGMKRVRNPRLRKMLGEVEADLPNMALEEPTLKADPSDIEKMSRVEKMTLAKRTNDDDTLAHLLASGDRSVIAILFQRGYRKGDAPSIYLENRLVTPGNFKKLSDDVAFNYLTNMPWDWTREKVRGKSVWKDWYTTILTPPDKVDLLRRMVEESLDRRNSLEQRDMIRTIAANYLPPDKMTPAVVAVVWEFAEDPLPLVRRIPKDERILLYSKNSGSFSESTWLFDLDREELTPFLKAHQLNDPDFISQHFGSSWGPMVVAPSTLNIVVWEDFWSAISSDDVSLLAMVNNFSTAIESALTDGYSISRYPGGKLVFFDDLYQAATRIGKLFLLRILPRSYTRRMREKFSDENLDEDLDALSKSQNAVMATRMAELESRYGGDFADAPKNLWLDIARAMAPDKLVLTYKLWKNSRSYFYYWDALEVLVADRCSKDDLVDFMDMDWKGYDTNTTYETVLARLDPSMSLQLVRVDSDPVRKWVVDNYPSSHIVNLLQGNPTYFNHVCALAERTEGSEVVDLLALVANSWPPTPTTSSLSAKNEAIACLIRKMPTVTDSYLDHTESVIRRAAVQKASLSGALKALEESEWPIFSEVSKRDDFLEDPTPFLEAYLKNPKLSGDYVHYTYTDDLRGLDAAALTMSDDEFKKAVMEVDALLVGSMENIQPWGIGAYVKYTQMEAPVGIGPSLQTRMSIRKSLSSVFQSLPTNVLLDTARKGPWETANADVWRHLASRVGNFEWVAHLSLKEIKYLRSFRDSLSWDIRNTLQTAQRHREEIEKYEKKGSLLDRVNKALETDDYAAVATILESGYKDPDEVMATSQLVRQIYTKTREEALKQQVVVHASHYLLDKMAENNVVARSLVLLHGPDDYITARFGSLVDRHMRDYLVEYKNRPGQAALKDTRLKAAMVERASPEQAMDLFIFYYKEQKEFGPKVREAFLEKLDTDAFANLLKKYLLSKKFNLRIKKFTLEMLPLVLKLDDTDVTLKFNGSSVFREKAIGGLGKAWDDLPTRGEKEKFLDDIRDRTMLERLLKILVERDLSLRAPLNEKFTIGSNKPGKTSNFLNSFQQSTSTTSHGELFRLSLEHASTAEVREWLLENPFRVFDYNKAATDVSTNTLRIDWIDDRENKKVSQAFLDTWDQKVHGSFSADVTRTYGVVTPRTPKRTSRNIRTLYHGTDYFAAGCIIQGGFKVMSSAKAGRLLGNGIYFSDIGSKVAQYLHAGRNSGVSRGRGQGVVLVCEVDLGNMAESAKISYPITNSNWMNHGYDSVYMERGTSYGSGRQMLNNEYCVQDVARIKILYVMDISRTRR